MMLFVQAHERFGRDGVGSALARQAIDAEAILFDPKDDLRLSNAEALARLSTENKSHRISRKLS